MTEQPPDNLPPPSGGNHPPPGGYPPPPGGFPPPPPPQGGAYPPPPPGVGGYAPPPPVWSPNVIGQLPQTAYTPWITRVLAWFIDYIPVFVIEAIGFGIMMATADATCSANECNGVASGLGVAAVTITGLLAFGFVIWNYGYRQGTTGSSIGKSILKFKVVSEKTGQPIGFGLSVVRQIAHLVDAIICYIGYLFPLWDSKRQTLADKIMTTVCLPTNT